VALATVELCCSRHGGGVRLQFGRRRRNHADDTADAGFELLGHVLHVAFALSLRVLFLTGDLSFHLSRFQEGTLEVVKRPDHGADFVLAIGAADADIEIVSGKFAQSAFNHCQRFDNSRPQHKNRQRENRRKEG